MKYHVFLTGATGLLGRYLLRDLLLADVPVAALVRPTRRLSAEQRVEAMMANLEEQTGRDIPRPYVLEGNICEPDLSLDPVAIDWVTQNCDLMLHNAASLTFLAGGADGEPWRSNVMGTRNVLDLCEKTGIVDFHHVSTAYVCGLRQGRVLEDELDVGQPLGNDYEKSKVEAETMIRSAPFLSPPTVHRPAIIIGDSQTGFTTTFHGFYAALRLAQTLVNSKEPNETGKVGDAPMRLSLDGSESKNLVPVDWVSAVMTHILISPEHHGKTYHLTPRHPVKSRLVRDVLEESNRFYGAVFYGSQVELEPPTVVEELFYEHMRVYNSYWRNDPIFDRTNTLAAAGHIPCPHVDREMLLRLSEVAIGMNFRWTDAAVRPLSKVTS